MTIWFFHGKEEYKISKEIDKLKSKLLDETFKAMNFRIFSSPSFDELLEICATAPLMFGNIMSLIHCENYFLRMKNKKAEFTDSQLKALDFALQNVSETHNIIFVCNLPRNDDKKVDGRSKLFKIFAKYANVKEFPEYRDYDKELSKCVSEIATEKGISIDFQTNSFLIKHLGVNLRLIDSELEKLSIAIYPQKKVTPDDILEYCTLQDDVFELADLIISNDKTAVLKQLSAVIERRHPLELIALLQTNLHKLIYIKSYDREKSQQEMMNDLGLRHEYPLKILQEKVRNKSLAELSDLKHRLTDAEFKIKTGKTLNPEHLLESVLL